MQSTAAEISPSANAGQIAGAILSAPKTDDLWARYYRSQKNENPAQALSEQFRSIEDNLSNHPELLAFMKELVKLERGALGKKDKSEEITKLRAELNGLEEFLDNQSAGIELPELPEDQQKLLEVLRHHTAQTKIRPIQTLMGLFRETWHHVKEEASHNKVAFGTLLAASLGALWFMNVRLGNSATLYIDPETTQITNLSMDALMDPNYVVQMDSAFYNPAMEPSCHDHLIQVVGKPTADFIKDIPLIEKIFPEHCSRLKTLLPEAQQNLQSAYDFINLRIGALIKDPAESLGDKVIPDSPFKQAFDIAAGNTAETLYMLNTVENVTLHSAIALTASFIAYKAGTMSNEETQESVNKIKDFVHRSTRNAPLSYIFGAAATVQGYMMNDGFSPDMVWLGLAGVLVGSFAHKVARGYNKEQHVLESTITVRENLARFSDPSYIVSDKRAEEAAPKKPGWLRRAWNKNTPMAVAGKVVGAGLIVGSALDIAFNRGELTGYATGGGAVVVPFLGYNAVEDTFAHIIFGIAGGAAGLTVAGIVNGAKKMKKGTFDGLKNLGRKITNLFNRKSKDAPASETVSELDTAPQPEQKIGACGKQCAMCGACQKREMEVG